MLKRHGLCPQSLESSWGDLQNGNGTELEEGGLREETLSLYGGEQIQLPKEDRTQEEPGREEGLS